MCNLIKLLFPGGGETCRFHSGRKFRNYRKSLVGGQQRFFTAFYIVMFDGIFYNACSGGGSSDPGCFLQNFFKPFLLYKSGDILHGGQQCCFGKVCRRGGFLVENGWIGYSAGIVLLNIRQSDIILLLFILRLSSEQTQCYRNNTVALICGDFTPGGETVSPGFNSDD